VFFLQYAKNKSILNPQEKEKYKNILILVENSLPDIVSKFEKLVSKIKTIGSSFSEKNPFRQCYSSIFTFITRT